MAGSPTGRTPRTRLRYSRIPVLRGIDLAERRLAVMEARSGREGSTVWLTGCIHGDEVGGVVVIQELFRRLRRRPMRSGRLCAFPLLNPFGFEAATRAIPATREDLNRCFPGDAEGTLGERIAWLAHSRILSDAPALVLDLHNDWIRSIPYALIDPRPASSEGRHAHTTARALAAATGFLLVDEQDETVTRAELRRTLTGSLLERGVPALTLELGSAFFVDEKSVAAGVDAIWNVLARLELVEPGAEGPAEPAHAPHGYRGRILRYSQRPCPTRSGIVRFSVHPGEVVAAGTQLGVIQDVFGRRLETVRAEADAVVLGHADSSLAIPGSPIVAMGIRPKAAEEPPAHPARRGPPPEA
jgi:hypothetical protein